MSLQLVGWVLHDVAAILKLIKRFLFFLSQGQERPYVAKRGSVAMGPVRGIPTVALNRLLVFAAGIALV